MPSPIVTTTLQAAGLSLISNVLAQFLSAYREREKLTLDLLQVIRFVALASLTAPPNYRWQQYLERKFPAYPQSVAVPPTKQDVENREVAARKSEEGFGHSREAPARGKINWRNTMTKWFLDCISVGATLNTLAFLILMAIMKGQGPSQVWQIVYTETGPLMIAGYKVWPIASIISFTFVPVHRRVVFASFVGLLWGIYMSLVAARV